MSEREELLALIQSARYSQPSGTAENAWNDAMEHIEDGLKNVPAPTQGAQVEETRMITDEDREYASELLADLTNDDLPRLEIAAQWFRKARVEHSLRSSSPASANEGSGR